MLHDFHNFFFFFFSSGFSFKLTAAVVAFTDSSSGGNQTYIHLQYTDSMTASETKTLASFLVPDFTGKWTKIGIEVSGESVVLYFKCTRFAIERPVSFG